LDQNQPGESEQPLQFFDCQSGVGKYVAQRALGHVPARMYRHSGPAAVCVSHDVMATCNAGDLEASPL
jgi:hypothetical protein